MIKKMPCQLTSCWQGIFLSSDLSAFRCPRIPIVFLYFFQVNHQGGIRVVRPDPPFLAIIVDLAAAPAPIGRQHDKAVALFWAGPKHQEAFFFFFIECNGKPVFFRAKQKGARRAFGYNNLLDLDTVFYFYFAGNNF